jgi:hypothetical protein
LRSETTWAVYLDAHALPESPEVAVNARVG